MEIVSLNVISFKKTYLSNYGTFKCLYITREAEGVTPGMSMLFPGQTKHSVRPYDQRPITVNTQTERGAEET